jgi:acylphosphatase
MDCTAKRVVVHGQVTGVGFRYATLCEARRHPGLAGYVRNADHRTVECLLQGPPQAVDAMVRWLRHGPAGAVVSEHTAEDIPVSPALADFLITG